MWFILFPHVGDLKKKVGEGNKSLTWLGKEYIKKLLDGCSSSQILLRADMNQGNVIIQLIHALLENKLTSLVRLVT